MGKMNSLFYTGHHTKDPFYASDELVQPRVKKTNNKSVVKNTHDSRKELLTDDKQNKWYFYRVDKKGKYDLVAANPQTGTIMKKGVYGTPNVYEFPEHVVVACEGDGETGVVYQFSKETLKLEDEWEIDGFIWDVHIYNNAVCVSVYVVDLDTARLYILQGRSIDFVELGTHFAPADLLVFDQDLYVSAYPLTENSPKKILKLNEKYDLEHEYKVSICPRFLFANGKEILIQELDVKTGRSDRYASLNLDTGKEIVSKRKRPQKRTNYL